MAERIELPYGGYWVDPSNFRVELRIDFQPFTVEITRGKKAGTTYTVTPVISWKRARQIVFVGKHASIGLTRRAKDWAKTAAEQLKGQWPFKQPIPKDVLISARIVSYTPDRRKVDASNLYQGPEDVMQVCQRGCKEGCRMHAGILADDCQIENHDGSHRRVDKKKPRVEITLTPYVPEPARLQLRLYEGDFPYGTHEADPRP